MTTDILQFRPREEPPEPPPEHPLELLRRTNDAEAFAAAVRASGGKITGKPWPDFERGWAYILWQNLGPLRVIHYWRPHHRLHHVITEAGRAKHWVALCGFDALSHDEHARVNHPGNYPRCKVCQRKHNKGWK